MGEYGETGENARVDVQGENLRYVEEVLLSGEWNG
jgi:hypothetical protein